jgi:chromosome segregation ATPase
MSNNVPNHELDKPVEKSKDHSMVIAALSAGLVLALAGDGFLLVRANRQADDLAQMQQSTQAQMAKLSDATTSLLEQRLQAINDEIRGANDAANTALVQARSETRKQGTKLAQRLDEQQKQVSDQLTQLQDATTTASAKINDVSSDVNGVKTDVTGVKTDVTTVKADVATTQAELEKTGADLKRAVGDMGVMSGLIATNSKDLVALRELGDRNYFEFDLTKRQITKKVGDVTLTMKKSDPKRNRYTVEILADDKQVEKRDKTINEPVQLYVSDNRQPYEIVVNQIKKDEIVGYLSTPKVKMARR